MKKYLITTADEATWKFDEPVIFLGDWCRLYNRKHIWKEMDFVVAKPYGLQQLKKDFDFSQIRELEKKLFPEFYELLNQNFGTSHNERFWQIILGSWFRKVLELLLNRINSLKECFENYNISGTTVYKNDGYSLPTSDYVSFENACEDNIWNNILNAHILAILKIPDVKIKYIENKIQHKKINLKLKNFKANQFSNSLILNFLITHYLRIVRRFIKKDDAFIINSYLPTKQEIKLEIALRQWPNLWKFYKRNLNLSESSNKPNINLRREIKKKFVNSSDQTFENIVREENQKSCLSNISYGRVN